MRVGGRRRDMLLKKIWVEKVVKAGGGLCGQGRSQPYDAFCLCVRLCSLQCVQSHFSHVLIRVRLILRLRALFRTPKK